MKAVSVIVVVFALLAGGFFYTRVPAGELAERAYAQALEFAKVGDLPRASVSFRNVFKHDPNNHEARAIYARLMLDSGNLLEASGQYLRLIEQDPDDIDARLTLAVVQITAGDWESAREHVTRAAAQAPGDLRVEGLQISFEYYDAIIDDVLTDKFAALAKARELRPKVPDLRPLTDVVIDGLISSGDHLIALPLIDAQIEKYPDELNLYLVRIGALDAVGQKSQVADNFQDLITRFPDSAELQARLVQWYLANDVEGAKRTLREWTSRGDVGAGAVLIRLVAEQDGIAAAIAEIDNLMSAGANENEFAAMRAGLDFDLGNSAEAIAAMQALVESSSEHDEKTRYRVSLAMMLDATGKRNDAESLLEDVVLQNPQNVEANVLKATWLLDRGDANSAVGLLRAAIDRQPNNPEILRLLARAHADLGELDLQFRMLALAVEVSDYAARDSVRYAAVLQAEDRLGAAIDVLREALRRSPENLTILTGLGDLYVRSFAWNRVAQIEQQMRSVDSHGARAGADTLRAKSLVAQGRHDEALAVLNESTVGADGGPAALTGVIRAQLLAGHIPRAYTIALDGVEAHADDANLKVILAMLSRMMDRAEDAEPIYRELLAELPDAESLWIDLIQTLRDMEQPDAALQAAREGSRANPQSLHLQWLIGILLENSGQYEDAIAAYLAINEVNSGIPTVANNLANLLATQRKDPDSLDLAGQLADRLKSLPQPEFRETYGWVAFQRGDIETALAYQIAAADELPQSAEAQFRAGQILTASDQSAAALVRYQAATALSSPEQTELREQIESARDQLVAGETETVLQ